MTLFLRQFSGELRRLFNRPRCLLGFAFTLLFEFGLSICYRLPGPRSILLADATRMHIDTRGVFSGLTSGSYLLGNVAMTVGAYFVALIGAESLGQEAEEGSLRLLLARPVSRARVYVQKAGAVAVYALGLGAFIGITSLSVGLLFEGRGPLLVVILAENILGTFEPTEGMQRFLLAIALLPLCLVTVALLAFAVSCFRVKPSVAVVAALTYLLAEASLRRIPHLTFIRESCLTSSIATWMNCFNQIIPTARITRDLCRLATIDSLSLFIGWLAFRRREFKP